MMKILALVAVFASTVLLAQGVRLSFGGVGFASRDCADDSNCSGHGTCQAGHCACAAGYMSRNCSVVCPGTTFYGNGTLEKQCSGNGECQRTLQRCKCSTGYYGTACESAYPVPTAPANATAPSSSVQNDSMTVSWQAPSNEDASSPQTIGTEYHVYSCEKSLGCSTSVPQSVGALTAVARTVSTRSRMVASDAAAVQDSDNRQLQCITTKTTCAVSGLKQGTLYVIQVFPRFRRSGFGDPVQIEQATQAEQPDYSSRTPIVNGSVTATSIRVDFLPPADIGGGSLHAAITHYRAEYRKKGTTEFTNSAEVTAATGTVTLSGLDVFSEYEIRQRAKNVEGYGDPSPLVEQKTAGQCQNGNLESGSLGNGLSYTEQCDGGHCCNTDCTLKDASHCSGHGSCTDGATCACTGGYEGTTCGSEINGCLINNGGCGDDGCRPTGPNTTECVKASCAHIKVANSGATSGVYWIDPDGVGTETTPFQVYCDMVTDGGGWMLYGVMANTPVVSPPNFFTNSLGKSVKTSIDAYGSRETWSIDIRKLKLQGAFELATTVQTSGQSQGLVASSARGTDYTFGVMGFSDYRLLTMDDDALIAEYNKLAGVNGLNIQHKCTPSQSWQRVLSHVETGTNAKMQFTIAGNVGGSSPYQDDIWHWNDGDAIYFRPQYTFCETLSDSPGADQQTIFWLRPKLPYAARSCTDVLYKGLARTASGGGFESGTYSISPDGGLKTTPTSVHCDLQREGGGWTQIFQHNTTEAKACPSPWVYTNLGNGLHVCQRPSSFCHSVSHSMSALGYTEVSGRTYGFQYASTDGFGRVVTGQDTLDGAYVDGVSLTRGSGSRTHVWSWAVGLGRQGATTNNCPCAASPGAAAPSFVGSNYYCSSGNPASSWTTTWYTANRLFTGPGSCDSAGTCCNNMATGGYFRRSVSTTVVSDPLETRICTDQEPANEDFGLEYHEVEVRGNFLASCSEIQTACPWCKSGTYPVDASGTGSGTAASCSF